MRTPFPPAPEDIQLLDVLSSSPAYLEALYAQMSNGDGPAEWRHFFENLRVGSAVSGATLATGPSQPPSVPTTMDPTASPHQATLDSIRAIMLIRAYRVRGHLYANLDPLGLNNSTQHPELDPENYGFTSADRQRPIYLDKWLQHPYATLDEVLSILQTTYCGNVGLEFMHIQDVEQKSWLQATFEHLGSSKSVPKAPFEQILEALLKAEFFEKFLHTKYPGAKRFGLDGGESAIVALQAMLDHSTQLGVRDVVMGMAHRGRLNVLANILNKPLVAIFSEFYGTDNKPESTQGDGDVKYHQGASTDVMIHGEKIHLSLSPNPSHLEAVDPVVLGKVRAKQDLSDDVQRRHVMGIMLHGDAAFAGQGLVAESLDLSQLEGYKTGGTFHLIINNQIGFTTSPTYSRSSPYCSDLAKTIQAPIFHVNGDDPVAVDAISRMAAEFRHKFAHDVVVDMYCYRRHGHNESDEPSFTQPLMYQAIAKHTSTYGVYRAAMLNQGTLKASYITARESAYKDQLSQAFDDSTEYKPAKAEWLEGHWRGIEASQPSTLIGLPVTGVPKAELIKVGEAIAAVPASFHAHEKIKRFLEGRRLMITQGKAIDWAMAEALAFGTLLKEGFRVRLSGQDCGRGTFSQRHAILYDQVTNEKYIPLQHIDVAQGPLEVIDSPLAEASVLGFEYGYSSTDPRSLVLWEAQFGDFANGAQVIIDQFIAAGESKWLRMSGLVMLLPHGYEGQGPEHSSARLERYLQLCGDDNMTVANCSTPANYFHILRRQLATPFRKPLILMTPKSLLRHKACVSDISDFTEGTTFQPVLPDASGLKPQAVERVILCSGKIYYDLLKERDAQSLKKVALVRLEQLYPYPEAALEAALATYPRSAKVIWCQEEPKNMGAWHYLDRQLEGLLHRLKFTTPRAFLVSRKDAASTATGNLKRHTTEQLAILQAALTGALTLPETLIK